MFPHLSLKFEVKDQHLEKCANRTQSNMIDLLVLIEVALTIMRICMDELGDECHELTRNVIIAHLHILILDVSRAYPKRLLQDCNRESTSL